ncbi:MAG: hypothetical protein K2N28_07335 [Muribaculaceae bacterium]|nr:hypothetical protein [Muribaculaceae bacterium]
MSKKYLNRLLHLVVPVVALCIWATASAAPAYYRKHVVLVVDQTPKTGSEHLKVIGDQILNFFNGEGSGNLPSGFEFNPEIDFIEVFLYGLEGQVAVWPESGNAYQLKLKASRDSDNIELFNQTIKYMVHPYIAATKFGSLTQWWHNELDEVFTARTALSQSIREESGYGLSAFLPNVVIPFIDKSVPAQEYYIIYVSTFQTGSTGQIASYDIDVLGGIYGSYDKAKSFNAWVKSLEAGYAVTKWIEVSSGNVSDKGVTAIGDQLVLSAAAHSSVNITSNIDLKQTAYGSKSFDILPLTVSFPKDSILEISNLQLVITKNGERFYSSELENYYYNDPKKEFVINPGTITFPKEISDKDILDFSLVFYPANHEGSSLLPYVFITGRELNSSAFSFMPSPAESHLGYIIVAALLLLVGILYWIWRSRAKGAKASIELNIWPISNSRYMDVSNNHVVNFDCWYFVQDQKEKNIQVSGNITPIYPSFAQKDKLVAEYMIEDVDQNEDFSFRPDGRVSNGDYRRAGEWYPLLIDEKGNFEFEITSYLEDRLKEPDYTREDQNVLRLKVLVRIHFEQNHKIVGQYIQKDKYYRFIVRPAIQNSDVWVALDPGTSGSCIAYGWGGLPVDTNNIHLACSLSTDTAGNQNLSPIFYSKVQILDHASIFDGEKPENMVPFDSDKGQGDFRFGNEAHIFWGKNSFQSIKKLLGYSNEFEVSGNGGRTAAISGRDLAHLLIKGLCREFEKYIQTSTTVNDSVRSQLLMDNQLAPSRAIVAVPNNYTVNKVQAMVDTIKRTNIFKEVHYIYEAEGVMMYYLNLNWADLLKVQHKMFVVFDMGGATINASAFSLNVKTGTKSGNTYVRSITVDTVSRVGYTVGGDNIDFSLISLIVSCPSIRESISNRQMTTEEFMKLNKTRLITFAQALKIDYIEKIAGHNLRVGNTAKSDSDFWTALFQLASDCGIQIPDKMTDEDHEYFHNESIHDTLKEQVLTSVTDAVVELTKDADFKEVELIISGRSILYPGIRKLVIETLKRAGRNVHQWNYGGSMEDKEIAVKTAVVRGACWYGMFSKYVQLRHDTVTSTFGYTDMVDRKIQYIPVVRKNTKFDENGIAEAEVEPMDPTINTVKFIQMLGSNFNEIYTTPIWHKMAELTQVPQSQITGTVRAIKVRIDAIGNFSYEISVAGLPKPLTGTCAIVDADITDSNSKAYAFAAMATPITNTASSSENYSVSHSKETDNSSVNIQKRGGRRF